MFMTTTMATATDGQPKCFDPHCPAHFHFHGDHYCHDVLLMSMTTNTTMATTTAMTTYTTHVYNDHPNHGSSRPLAYDLTGKLFR